MALEWRRETPETEVLVDTRGRRSVVRARVFLGDNTYEVWPTNDPDDRIYGVGASLEGARREALEELQESLPSPRRRTRAPLTSAPPEYRSREDILGEEIFRRFQ